MSNITFKTTLEGEADGPTSIEAPASAIEKLGGGKKPKVAVTVNGYTYRNSVFPMADGRFMIPFSIERRRESGINVGDALTVVLQLDTAPRTVTIPPDLKAALKKAGILDTFEALSYTYRNTYATSVAEAKAEDTKQRRIAKIVAEVKAKRS